VTELKRQRRDVEQKAAAVERDKALLTVALERTLDRFKRDISSPKALLALFVAGLVYGVARRGGTSESGADGSRRRRAAGGNLTRTATALLSAARLIELARRAEGFGPSRSRKGARSAGAAGPGEPSVRPEEPSVRRETPSVRPETPSARPETPFVRPEETSARPVPSTAPVREP
jgi:hypothetical protein